MKRQLPAPHRSPPGRAWLIGVALGLAVVLAGVTAAAQPASQAAGDAKPPLVFFGDRTLEPYEFLDDGQARGASVELIEALGRQMGRKVELRLLDWTEAQARLLAGEGDALTLLARSVGMIAWRGVERDCTNTSLHRLNRILRR